MDGMELQRQRQQQQRQQEQLHEHLISLQSWDAGQEGDIQKTRSDHRDLVLQRQEEINQMLAREAEERLPALAAGGQAEGAPVQEQAPASKSWKQRRKERKTAEKLDREVAVERQDLLQTSERMKQMADTTAGMERISRLNFTGYAGGYMFDNLADFRVMIENNPAAYAENKEVVDALYKEIYRTVDSSGDILLEIQSLQAVIDTHNIALQGPLSPDEQAQHREMRDAAFARQESLTKTNDMMIRQINAMGDAMRFYLRGSELSTPAKAILRGLPLEGYAAAKNAVNVAFLGQTGAVAMADRAYQQGLDRGDNLELCRSYAKQALGIRRSDSPQAQADKLMRGSTYVGIPGDIAVFFGEQETAGFQFAQAANQETGIQRQNIPNSAASVAFGAGIEGLTSRLLERMRPALVSEESLSYVKHMTGIVKDAQVFEGDLRNAVSFIMQGLMNSYGANFTQIRSLDTIQDKQNVYSIGRETCRNLLSISGLSDTTHLPESLHEVYNQYQALIDEVTERIRSEAGQ